MRPVHLFSALAAVGLLPIAVSQAQQVTVATPYHALSDSFFENIGTSWGLNWQNGFFRFGGGPVSAAPQFGGFDPSAGVQGGWAFRRNGLDGFFNFAAAQGYRQTFTTQTPSVTLMNGQTGFISDTSQSPFVISYIPIVGGIPTVPPPYATMAYPGYTMAPVLQPMVPVSPPMPAWRQQMAQQNQAAAAQAVPRQPQGSGAARAAHRSETSRRGPVGLLAATLRQTGAAIEVDS